MYSDHSASTFEISRRFSRLLKWLGRQPGKVTLNNKTSQNSSAFGIFATKLYKNHQIDLACMFSCSFLDFCLFSQGSEISKREIDQVP